MSKSGVQCQQDLQLHPLRGAIPFRSQRSRHIWNPPTWKELGVLSHYGKAEDVSQASVGSPTSGEEDLPYVCSVEIDFCQHPWPWPTLQWTVLCLGLRVTPALPSTLHSQGAVWALPTEQARPVLAVKSQGYSQGSQ